MIVALDKRTGKTIWANTELNEVAAYCAPILVNWKGARHLITMTQKSIICVNPETGKMRWSHPHVTPNDQNIDQPIFHDGYVLVASGHQAGAAMVKINDNLAGVTAVWSRKELDNCHGGMILQGGFFYGSACRSGGKMFFCADFLTGAPQQTDKTLPKLSLTCAEGMLYALGHRGKVMLLSIKPGGWDMVSQFDLPREDKDDCLTHPVLCGGRLYIRHANVLYAYDVAQR